MRTITAAVAVGLAWSLTYGIPGASAQGCVPEIRTVETMIEQLTGSPEGQERHGEAVDGPWMIDIPAAREELDDARAYLQEGLELNCRLHVAEAMKRLGRMQ